MSPLSPNALLIDPKIQENLDIIISRLRDSSYHFLSSDEKLQIQDKLAEGKERLVLLDTQIQLLLQHRAHLVKHIHISESILAPPPINHLPEDLLVKIFLSTRDICDDRGLILPDEYHCSTVFSSVCTRWRLLVLSRPECWNRIGIDISQTLKLSEYRQPLVKQHLDMRLNRSGNSPLDIELDAYGNENLSEYHINLIKTLLHHAKRFRSANMAFDNELAEVLASKSHSLAVCWPENFSHLETLEVVFWSPFSQATVRSIFGHDRIFMNAPLLKRLILSGNASLGMQYPLPQVDDLELDTSDGLSLDQVIFFTGSRPQFNFLRIKMQNHVVPASQRLNSNPKRLICKSFDLDIYSGHLGAVFDNREQLAGEELFENFQLLGVETLQLWVYSYPTLPSLMDTLKSALRPSWHTITSLSLIGTIFVPMNQVISLLAVLSSLQGLQLTDNIPENASGVEQLGIVRFFNALKVIRLDGESTILAPRLTTLHVETWRWEAEHEAELLEMIYSRRHKKLKPIGSPSEADRSEQRCALLRRMKLWLPLYTKLQVETIEALRRLEKSDFSLDIEPQLKF